MKTYSAFEILVAEQQQSGRQSLICSIVYIFNPTPFYSYLSSSSEHFALPYGLEVQDNM